MAMKILQGLFEKLIIAILFTVVVYFFNLLIPFLDLIPKLSIYVGPKLLIDTKYTSYLFIILSVYLILSTYLSTRLVWNRELSKICPQFRFFSEIAVFSSNGWADYHYKKEGNMLEITLQNFSITKDNKDSYTTSADCGIIFLKDVGSWPFLKGYRIDDKKGITFEIRGKDGGENIGISFKNIHGYEQKLLLSKFIEGNIERDRWTEVDIELDNFEKVTRSIRGESYIECFTFFTNSKLSQAKPVTFYLRGIRFY